MRGRHRAWLGPIEVRQIAGGLAFGVGLAIGATLVSVALAVSVLVAGWVA